VGENKKFRKQIASWLERIAEHETKITEELKKPNPDQGLIDKASIANVARRLPGGRT
jgi:hypothetical protein